MTDVISLLPNFPIVAATRHPPGSIKHTLNTYVPTGFGTVPGTPTLLHSCYIACTRHFRTAILIATTMSSETSQRKSRRKNKGKAAERLDEVNVQAAAAAATITARKLVPGWHYEGDARCAHQPLIAIVVIASRQ